MEITHPENVDLYYHEFIIIDTTEHGYFFTYCSILNVIHKLELNSSDLHYYAYVYGNYAQGVVFSNSKALKEEIAKVSKKNIGAFTDSIKNLQAKKVIIKLAPNTYRLNDDKGKISSNNSHKAVFEILFKEK